MKVKLSEWGERNFTEKSRPCADTLRKMAEGGDIDGATRIRGRWYVELGKPAYSADELLKMAVQNDPEMLKVMGL